MLLFTLAPLPVWFTALDLGAVCFALARVLEDTVGAVAQDAVEEADEEDGAGVPDEAEAEAETEAETEAEAEAEAEAETEAETEAEEEGEATAAAAAAEGEEHLVVRSEVVALDRVMALMLAVALELVGAGVWSP
jgi:chemotaxis protein histidine kinase CheA